MHSIIPISGFVNRAFGTQGNMQMEWSMTEKPGRVIADMWLLAPSSLSNAAGR
jgi:hypothetical protein